MIEAPDSQAATSIEETAAFKIHELGRELDIDGDLTSNVLAPIHNTTVRVSNAEKLLDD